MFSYGFQFELERGQSNIIAFSLGVLAVYLYHSRDDLDYLAYLLFSTSLQMKIYPAILIVMFIRDWRDWKGNVKRIAGLLLFNVALLFILGPRLFRGFLRAVRAQQAYEASSPLSHALKGYVAYLGSGDFTLLAPGAQAFIRQYQGPIELLLLAVLGLCLLLILISAYRQRMRGLNANLLAICTICAMVIPSISNNYKLPILIAPMAILWCSLAMPTQGWKKILSIILIIIASLAYWSTQYPINMKPELVKHNFPALFAIAIIVTILSFVAPSAPDAYPGSHEDSHS
jgi:predicted branched-subunit amino acid permease